MDGRTPPPKGYVSSRNVQFPWRGAIIGPHIRAKLQSDSYEAKEAEAALRMVRPGDVVMELGGGIGFMSAILSKNRDVDHIHVFEANAALVDYMHETHAANGLKNITVHHAVLGKRKGTAPFYVRKQFMASSLDEKDGMDVIDTQQVEVRNAKSAIKAIKPTFLICDIEGAEAQVIPLLDLSTVRTAVVELHPQWIGPEGVNTVFRAFMDAGLAYAPRQSMRKVVTFRRAWPLK
ncbi:MAG: FkbM family methyltransferase [Pseudomonadota bacterium]